MLGTGLTIALGQRFRAPVLDGLFEGASFNRAATAVQALNAIGFLAMAANVKATAAAPGSSTGHQTKGLGIGLADS